MHFFKLNLQSFTTLNLQYNNTIPYSMLQSRYYVGNAWSQFLEASFLHACLGFLRICSSGMNWWMIWPRAQTFTKCVLFFTIESCANSCVGCISCVSSYIVLVVVLVKLEAIPSFCANGAMLFPHITVSRGLKASGRELSFHLRSFTRWNRTRHKVCKDWSIILGPAWYHSSSFPPTDAAFQLWAAAEHTWVMALPEILVVG